VIRIIIALIAVFTFAASNTCHAGQFKVTRVYDGDSFKAVGHDIEIKVRLVGIDAPETPKGKRKAGQPFSKKAKQLLAKMILDKTVDIKGYGMGPYNRQLAVVSVEGKNVNLELIKAGLAEVYRGKHPEGFDITPYQIAEVEAQRSGIGMWALGDEYISPKDWRKNKKQKLGMRGRLEK
jgi:micrococcal nuclease